MMNEVQICQFELTHPKGRKDRIAIFNCSLKVENPKGLLDEVVSKYVGNTGYNEFVESNLKNPWMRVVINDINELKYIPFKPKQYKGVQLFAQNLVDNMGNASGKISIFRGGLNSERPISFMNDVVEEYAEKREYKEFIEIFLDNPWVRVVFFDIDSIEYVAFKNQKINDNI